MPRTFQIVVADDDVDIRRHYERTLSRVGHQVLAQAANGHELVELCQSKQPELAISDIALRGLDGILAMERVRSEYDIPFILVSAHNDQEHLERAREHNVLSYLVKPIKKADLLSALAIAATIITVR